MPAPPFVDPWLPSGGGGVPTVRPAVPIAVYRITGTSTLSYHALPSVRCVAIEEHEGPAPASALFRYAFDGCDPTSPQNLEQALSTTWTGAGVVAEGDRLAVQATQPGGATAWLFDGFALTWKAELDGETESVTIAAVGTAKRAWDTPVGGMTFRNSQAPETAGSDVPTSLPAAWNPRGQPNASPSTGDSGTPSYKYPVFMDQNVTGTDADSNAYPRLWELNHAVAYLLYCPTGANLLGGQTWIQAPSRSSLDSLLIAREPITGTPFDPGDVGTYTAVPIQVPDTPVSGRPWPTVLSELIGPSGFGMRFALGSDGSGNPQTTLSLWLRQAATAKPILLPARGSSFDPSWCNVGAARLARDLAGCVTVWRVRGGLTRYEVSVVLAPGFPSNAADVSNLSQFDSTDPAFATSAAYDLYRVFVLDEDGTGHYAPGSATVVSGTPTSLDSVLGAPVGGVPQYVARRRAPVGRLLSVDELGRPLAARLAISTDYAGTMPGVWDGTGTWRHIPGGWTHLPDRIGIRVAVQHPNHWDTSGATTTDTTTVPRIANTVEAMNSAAGLAPFFLRYTLVFEADSGVTGLADLSGMAPLSNSIERDVDARDRYLIEKIHHPSEFNATSADLTVRDDSAAAQAEAVALRTASEAGVMEGHVLIPRFTAYYAVGDRISSIQGRNLGLRTDSAGTGYAPVYPVVVSRRWELDGHQHTLLTLSDSGLNRRKYATTQPHAVHLPPVRTVRLNRSPAAPSQPLAEGTD